MAPTTSAVQLTLLLAALGDRADATGATLKNCAADNSYCYGYYGNTWCWLVTTKGGSTYAKDGANGYSCASYNGYSASEYCYEPAAPASGSETTGSSLRATGGDASAAESTGNWQCPSSWYTSQPTDSEAEQWTMAANQYRCMHDVQFAKWSNPVANDIKDYLAPLTSMVHSDCYSVPAPAGPAGENLFWGSGGYTPGDAAASWYSEISDPGCSLPGCDSGNGMGTGHFTAMVWAGVKEIGCTSNSHGLKACRYKGSDSLDCSTPNMGGCYDANVPALKQSFSTCKAKVEQCFGAKLPDGVQPARLFSLGEGAAYPAKSSWMLKAGTLAAMVAVVAGVALAYRRQKTSAARLLQAEDQCESGEE